MDDRIVADVLCNGCGAPLRGLSINEQCSECGHACSDSVYGDYLIYAEQPQVRKLEEGARVVLSALGVLGGLMGLAMVATVTTAAEPDAILQRAYEVLFAGVLLLPIVATTGIALLTSRRSVAYYEAAYLNPRMMIRLGLVFAAMIAVVSVGVVFLPEITQAILLTAWATMPLTMFLRGLASLMRRVPNYKLAQFASGTCAVAYVLGVLTLFFLIARPYTFDDQNWDGFLLALQFFTTTGWIALGIALYRL
jgi:hypothetical protein